MNLVERLAGNTFFLFLDWFLVTALSFVFWTVVWKSLPPESAGIIATSLNMIILISTFGIFGMHGTLNKLIPEYARKREEGRIRALIRFSNKILFAINSAMMIGFLAVVLLFGVDIKLPLEAVIAIAIGIFIWPFANSTTSILYGLQNMKRILMSDVVANVMKVGIAAALIFAGLNFIGPLAALLISFFALIFLRRDVLQFGKSVKHVVDKHHVLVKYAVPSFFASISWALFINTPTIILTLFDSLRSSGIFAASLSLTNPLAFIPTIVAQALFPLVSSLMVVRNHAKRQAQLIQSVIRYVVFVSLPIFVIYIFFAKAFVLVLAQLEYLQAVQLIPIVGFAVLVQGIGHIFLSSLFAIRKTEANRNVTAVTAAVFLGTSIPMTMLMGIMGLVWSFVLSVIVFTSLSYAILKRYLKFSLPFRSIGKVSAASLSLFAVLFVPEYLGYGIVEKLPFLAIGLVAYFWILAKIGFYSSEDLMIIRFAQGKIPALEKPLNSVENFIRRSIKR